MNLADVMDQLAQRLSAIDGLEARAFPESPAHPPAAFVRLPEEITYDETYGRGMDRISLEVEAVVGGIDKRSTRDAIAAFCDGSGPRSFKQVLESGEYDAFDTVRVESVQFGRDSIAGVEQLVALFTLDITGSGA